MSNYLSRLVAKSFNTAELIQPRLTSLFEPPAPGGHVFEVQNPLEQLNAAAESDRIRIDALQPLQPEPILTKNNLESQPTEVYPLITNTPIQNTLDRIVERSDTRSRHLINRTSLSKQMALQPDNSVLQSAQNQPASNSTIIDRDESYNMPLQETSRTNRDTKPKQDIRPISIKLSASVKPQVTELPSSIITLVKTNHDFPESNSTIVDRDESYAVPPQDTSRKSRELKSEQVIRPISIKRVASPVNTVSKTNSQILHSGPQKVITEPTEPAVIHVTIGSIEVRAIKAPEQIPKQSTRLPGPRLSLDDYLRSRKGDKL